MQLIQIGKYKGYDYDDILKSLNDKDKESFKWFMLGQTLGVLDNKCIVYLWDYERFLEIKQYYGGLKQ